jgi:hypothetical protein
LYWVRKNDGTQEHHIYIGKSVDIAHRYTKHHATIMGSSEIISSRNHYTIARLAISSGGGFRAVKVCFTISEKLHLKLLSTDYFRLQNGISTLCLVIQMVMPCSDLQSIPWYLFVTPGTPSCLELLPML